MRTFPLPLIVMLYCLNPLVFGIHARAVVIRLCGSVAATIFAGSAFGKMMGKMTLMRTKFGVAQMALIPYWTHAKHMSRML